MALREPSVGFVRSNKGWLLLTPLLGAAAAGTLVGAWLLYKDLLLPLRTLAREIEKSRSSLKKVTIQYTMLF